jgi:hypothetical protein
MRLFAPFIFAFAATACVAACLSCSALRVTEPLPPVPAWPEQGLAAGSFEVIRYDEAGKRSTALNGTLDLDAAARDFGLVEVSVGIADASPTRTVALDVRYDPLRYTLVQADLTGLLGSDGDSLGLAVLDRRGVAGLGQTRLGDPQQFAAARGKFATLQFRARPAPKHVSFTGGAHHNALGISGGWNHLVMPNLQVDIDAPQESIDVRWTAAWHRADGDQNGEVNLADLTPIGQKYGRIPSEDWTAVPADYDSNNEVFIPDLTPIGVYYLEGTEEYAVEIRDDGPGPRTLLGMVKWFDAQPPTDPHNPNGEALTDVFKHWGLQYSAATSPSYTELFTYDADADGRVSLIITPMYNGYLGVSTAIRLPDGDISLVSHDQGSGGDI